MNTTKVPIRDTLLLLPNDKLQPHCDGRRYARQWNFHTIIFTYQYHLFAVLQKKKHTKKNRPFFGPVLVNDMQLQTPLLPLKRGWIGILIQKVAQYSKTNEKSFFFYPILIKKMLHTFHRFLRKKNPKKIWFRKCFSFS